MFPTLYTFGLSLMARPPVPGFISVGAVIVRVARELDPDDARRDRAWDKAKWILDEQKRGL